MSPLPAAALVLLAAPLAALAFGFFVTHRVRPRTTHLPILASCAAVAAASLALLGGALGGASWSGRLFTWISAAGVQVHFGLLLDPLSVSVLSMVAVVGFLIHIYAVGYMRHDAAFSRFFLYFHLFFFAMVGLLTSDNYLQLYLFWEGVGLASFLLIGFWQHKPTARAAAWKAFLTNRVGDVGFLLAILLLFRWTGTVAFADLFSNPSLLSSQKAFIVGFLLFWGACAKSAQFPLYVWLPDAMEGPTPVSALMHAATMVTAGVFLLARSYPLLERAPGLLPFIALVGAFTAVWGAVGAFFRKDIKRILAYSTVSHLGLMTLGRGGGGVFPAVFHLIVHGFFKAALFLCAGNVIHGLHDSLGGAPTATVDDAGGLRASMPMTFAAFTLGAVSLAGVPPFGGFWSKEFVLAGAFGTPALAALGLLTALGSSLYIGRMLFLTFLGRRSWQKGHAAHAHEAPPVMWVPVLLLSLGGALAGFLAAPLARLLGVEPHHASHTVTALSIASMAAGFGLAWAAADLAPGGEPAWRSRHPALLEAVESDFGWQPFCDRAAGAVAGAARFLGDIVEGSIWDPGTEDAAAAFPALSEVLGRRARGILNDYALLMTAGAAGLAILVSLCF
ncbi:MAG: NADH-quinone oxidoreductase subunit L [Elusimicrobia bacterium]|nr:NADH-quinone oxidoreductase subunit L [Elusimicrobiota bacterium]